MTCSEGRAISTRIVVTAWLLAGALAVGALARAVWIEAREGTRGAASQSVSAAR